MSKLYFQHACVCYPEVISSLLLKRSLVGTDHFFKNHYLLDLVLS